MKIPTICLTMIVKNESHVIERCIRSVVPFIDSFLIADTGSTDDTSDKILKLMSELGKSGQVVHHEWEDFGTNRSRVFKEARSLENPADYALVIDADDTLEFSDLEKAKSQLGIFDFYDFDIVFGGHRFKRPHLFRQSLFWYYKGTIHEYAECLGKSNSKGQRICTRGHLTGVNYVCVGGGGRHVDPERGEKEISLLKKQLEIEPDNSRSAFYLAQTYYDHWRIPEAIEWNEMVLTMRGWTEERFMAALRLGDLYLARGEDGDEDKAQDRYIRAMCTNPNRAEPLERLARYHRNRKLPGWAQASYMFAKRGSEITPDPHGFLVDIGCHDSKIWDELSLAAFYTGRIEESISSCQKVIDSSYTSSSVLERATNNMKLMVAQKLNILNAASIKE